MTLISKNAYVDKLGDIVNKYNTRYHEEINCQLPNFKIGDFVRISKYKNIFAKNYVPNWSDEVFVIEKI